MKLTKPVAETIEVLVNNLKEGYLTGCNLLSAQKQFKITVFKYGVMTADWISVLDWIRKNLDIEKDVRMFNIRVCAKDIEFLKQEINRNNKIAA